MTYTKTKRKPWKIITPIVIIVVVVIGGYVIWHHHTDKPAAVITQTGTATPDSNVPTPQPVNDNPTTNSIPNSKDNASNQPGSTPNSNVQPIEPTGNFISNHRPTTSGTNPGPAENSTCNTTPGVMCEIRFTSGSTVKILPAQRTDANGSAAWNWTINDTAPGLTPGTWQVSAVAINGSKTTVATDAAPLVVPQ